MVASVLKHILNNAKQQSFLPVHFPVTKHHADDFIVYQFSFLRGVEVDALVMLDYLKPFNHVQPGKIRPDLHNAFLFNCFQHPENLFPAQLIVGIGRKEKEEGDVLFEGEVVSHLQLNFNAKKDAVVKIITFANRLLLHNHTNINRSILK